MLRHRAIAAALLLLAGAPTARAQTDLDTDLARNEPAFLSHSFLDSLNRTRAHVTTRAGFFGQDIGRPDGTTDNRDTVLGSVEIAFILRGTENFSVTTLFPIGWEATDGFDAIALYGNTRVGFNFGGDVQLPGLQPEGSLRAVPKLGLAGALELYLPTALDPTGRDCGARDSCSPMRNLRRFRASEPELWSNDAAWIRARWHTDLRFDIVQAELELGLTPGVSIEESADFLLLGNWAARVAVLPIPELEGFVEFGASYGLVVPDDRPFPRVPGNDFEGETDFSEINNLDTPVRMALGLRLHIADISFDPGLFVSFDFDDGDIMVGLDLAGMVRSRPGARLRRERDSLDF